MSNMPIYTLEYLEAEASAILSAWNGEDAQFIDAHGETRTEDDVYHAKDMLNYIDSIKTICKELKI